MVATRKPVPKTQVELSQQTIIPYLNQGKGPVPSNLRRENQRSVKNDDVKQFQVGLQDIDEAIFYYFNNVIRPSVIQNSTRLNVPVIYGSPEKWSAVQKDGYYRDNNGKIQLPLIMFKRDSVEKNRTMGNKMDANNPIHFGIFERKYSPKNFYDRFSALSNRIPVKEYYGVIMPDYVNLVYTCIIFTEYVEQMNSIVESVNYASDSYWGDPDRFKFRAAIDSYTTATEHVQGETRSVKTTFQIKLAGYIVPDSINTAVANPNKYYSKAAIKFTTEVVGALETLGTYSDVQPVTQFTKLISGTSNTVFQSEHKLEFVTSVEVYDTITSELVEVSIFRNGTIINILTNVPLDNHLLVIRYSPSYYTTTLSGTDVTIIASEHGLTTVTYIEIYDSTTNEKVKVYSSQSGNTITLQTNIPLNNHLLILS